MIIFSSIKADKTMEWFRRREKIFRRKLIWSRMGFFFSYQTGQTPVKWSHYTLTLNQSQFSVRWGILDAEMEDGHL